MKDDSLIESVFNSVSRADYEPYLRLGNLICSFKDEYGKQPENSVAPDLPLIYVKVTVVAMGRVLILIQDKEMSQMSIDDLDDPFTGSK